VNEVQGGGCAWVYVGVGVGVVLRSAIEENEVYGDAGA
jgi:hypothetical protein